MAKIVYGYSGEGSGHSSRTREMAAHLIRRGHTVRLASYDRGYRNLQGDFDVLEIEGLSIASGNNQVSVVRTFTDNIKKLPNGQRTLKRMREQLFERFQPDCVFTDFEPLSAYLANHYDLPLITLDNQHRMRYMKCDYPSGTRLERRATKMVIRAMVPRPDVSLAITFYFGQVKNNRTFLFPPILRDEVLQRQPTPGSHILVYLTSGFDSCLDELKRFGRESFLVYGYDRDDRDGALQFKRFSRDGFLDDLATAKAVIATAGFTLISEAMYLRKPYLAMPMQGQFEQRLNAFQLGQLGYGKDAADVSGETIGDFLYRIPDYATRLGDYAVADNSAIQAKLDELLANDCSLAREFHRQRQ